MKLFAINKNGNTLTKIATSLESCHMIAMHDMKENEKWGEYSIEEYEDWVLYTHEDGITNIKYTFIEVEEIVN